MNNDAERLLNAGQLIGSFPHGTSMEFVGLVAERLPGHRFACLGGSDVKLVVYPPLAPDRLTAWRNAYRSKCRELGIE